MNNNTTERSRKHRDKQKENLPPDVLRASQEEDASRKRASQEEDASRKRVSRQSLSPTSKAVKNEKDASRRRASYIRVERTKVTMNNPTDRWRKHRDEQKENLPPDGLRASQEEGASRVRVFRQSVSPTSQAVQLQKDVSRMRASRHNISTCKPT